MIKYIIFDIISLGDILKFQINDYTILVEVISDDKELKTIHVICENSNNDLGLFYTNKIDKETIKNLVLNTYEIIFNKNSRIQNFILHHILKTCFISYFNISNFDSNAKDDNLYI